MPLAGQPLQAMLRSQTRIACDTALAQAVREGHAISALRSLAEAPSHGKQCSAEASAGVVLVNGISHRLMLPVQFSLCCQRFSCLHDYEHVHQGRLT